MWTFNDIDEGYYQKVGPVEWTSGGIQAAGVYKKYTNWQTRGDERDAADADSDINLRLIRYSDILLMYAECLIKGSKRFSFI